MTIQELERQLLSLDPDEKRRLIRFLSQSLVLESSTTSMTEKAGSLVTFFRNSPLCEVADELDLTRDQSLIPDRIRL